MQAEEGASARRSATVNIPEHKCRGSRATGELQLWAASACRQIVPWMAGPETPCSLHSDELGNRRIPSWNGWELGARGIAGHGGHGPPYVGSKRTGNVAAPTRGPRMTAQWVITHYSVGWHHIWASREQKKSISLPQFHTSRGTLEHF